MKLISAYNKILSMPTKVFKTEDVSILLGITNKHGNQLLTKLSAEKLIIHLRRGLWALQDSLDPFILPDYLTAPLPSYISLQSALYFHGLISQIPSNIYVVSIARTRSYDTPVGLFSIHHIQPNLFLAFDTVGEHHIKMAQPEKALFDFFYLKATKSKLFYSLPEVEFPDGFNWEKVLKYADQIENVSRKVMVLKLITRYCD
jgi:predicted transcriptional regulator of viral defense system